MIDNPNELCANVLYDGVASNPLVVPAPDIDVALFFTIDPEGRTVSVRGAVNAFPDYEVYTRVDGGPPDTLIQRFVLFVGGAGVEAVVELPEVAVEQVSECRGVPIAGCSATVIVCPRGRELVSAGKVRT